MSEDNDDWVLYRDRPDWNDVIPEPQDDGPATVVSISYTEKFLDVYDYFRGILKRRELSERALELTKDAVSLNTGNYTVWQYRREILKGLQKDLKDELEYTEVIIRTAEKNYQVWHHRRVIVEWIQDASDEDRITKIFLNSDPKNYHAWQHRQWYIRTFGLYDGELEFVESLLANDVRNNSAWNQRYFVVNNTTEFTQDVLEREIEYTLEKINLVKRNESSWNYLRGIMLHVNDENPVRESVRQFCENLYDSGERSQHLLAYIVDMCEYSLGRNSINENLNVSRAEELCKVLANEVDTIRHRYWQYVAHKIAEKATMMT